MKKEYEKLIEEKNNEITKLKQNEWNNKKQEEKNLLNEENNSLKIELVNSKKIIELLLKEINEINKKIKEKEDEYNKIIKSNKEYEKIKNEMKNKNDELELNLSGSTNVKEPLKGYKIPTLVGLNNIGAPCFMNSILQCLSQTKGLTNYFLNEKNKENIINNNIALKNKNNFQLSPVYLELIKILWKKNGEKSFSPNKFMETINNMNPLFKTGQAGDAKDFIIFWRF